MELLKQRLLGAFVILSLAIVFLPEIFTGNGQSVFLAENHEGNTLPYQLALADHAADVEVVNAPMMQKVANEQAASEIDAWSIRVGAFSDPVVAEHLEQKLRQQGYAAYVQSSDNQVHNVLVGPELAASNAQVVQKQLQQHLKLNGVIVPHESVLYVQSSSIQQG